MEKLKIKGEDYVLMPLKEFQDFQEKAFYNFLERTKTTDKNQLMSEEEFYRRGDEYFGKWLYVKIFYQVLEQIWHHKNILHSSIWKYKIF